MVIDLPILRSAPLLRISRFRAAAKAVAQLNQAALIGRPSGVDRLASAVTCRKLVKYLGKIRQHP